MKRERCEIIPLCRIKLKTTATGRIHEESDIGIHSEVEPRFLHKVCLESTTLPSRLIFDEDNHVTMTIGRSASCALQINKKDVSSSHCCIVLKQKGLYIVDMDSLNGSFINNIRVRCGHHILLRHGDHIKLAKQDIFEVKYSPFMQTATDFGIKPGFEFKQHGKLGPGYYMESHDVESDMSEKTIELVHRLKE